MVGNSDVWFNVFQSVLEDIVISEKFSVLCMSPWMMIVKLSVLLKIAKKSELLLFGGALLSMQKNYIK